MDGMQLWHHPPKLQQLQFHQQLLRWTLLRPAGNETFLLVSRISFEVAVRVRDSRNPTINLFAFYMVIIEFWMLDVFSFSLWKYSSPFVFYNLFLRTGFCLTLLIILNMLTMFLNSHLDSKYSRLIRSCF